MRKQLPSLMVGLILVLTLGLYMVGFTVRTTEVAIIKTFGKAEPQDVITEPGFRWKWPSPIQQVVKYDNRIRVFNDTFEETTTGDKKNLIVTAFSRPTRARRRCRRSCAGWSGITRPR